VRYAVEVERDPAFVVDAYLPSELQVSSLARILPTLGNRLVRIAAGLPGRRLEAILGPFLAMLLECLGRIGS
jgi:hypothetical protein